MTGWAGPKVSANYQRGYFWLDYVIHLSLLCFACHPPPGVGSVEHVVWTRVHVGDNESYDQFMVQKTLSIEPHLSCDSQFKIDRTLAVLIHKSLSVNITRLQLVVALPTPLTTRHESPIRAEAVQLIVHHVRHRVRSLGLYHRVRMGGAGYRQEGGVMKEMCWMAEMEMASSLS